MSRPQQLFLAVIVLLLPLMAASAQSDTATVGAVPEVWQVIEGTNQVRQSQGLPPLRYNPLLEQSAQAHSDAMAADDFFSHDNPTTGTSPSDRITAAGYGWQANGENIAIGNLTAASVVEGWVNSPDHYANMINSGFTEIGIGIATSPTDATVTYWTQNFGNQFDNYPVVLNHEAYSTTETTVDGYAYAPDDVIDMRISVNGNVVQDWQSFTPNFSVEIPAEAGEQSVMVELRTANETFTATDTILFDGLAIQQATPVPTDPPAPPTADPNAGAGNSGVIATPIPNTGATDTIAERGSFVQAPTLNPDPPTTQDDLVRLDWWLFLPLIMILLIVLFVLWHRRQAHEWWFYPLAVKNGTASWVCVIFRLLFLVYLIFMAYAIGDLTRNLREDRGKIIWQLDGNSAQLVFFDDYTESLRELPNFESEGCIGCHVFNEETNRLVYITGGLNGEAMLWDGDETTSLGFNTSYVAFSNDGTQLVFAKDDEDLYIYDFETGTETPLEGASEPEFIETMPSWSFDGKTIIFARSETPLTGLDDRLALPTDLYTVPVGVEDAQATPFPGGSEPGIYEYYPRYSPDGIRVAFTRHDNETTYADPAAEIWMLPVIGGNATRLAANDDAATGQRTPGNSWAVWSNDARWLAFGTQRQGITYDVLITQISPDGQSGDVYSLQGASAPGVLELTPVWWVFPAKMTLAEFIQQALLWLLPIIPFLWLIRIVCRGKVVEEPEEVELPPVPPLKPATPLELPVTDGLAPLWQPQPALILGLGDAGRHVLTQLKKSLSNAGLGVIDPRIAFLCLAQGSNSEQERDSFRFAGVELANDELILWRDSLKTIIEQSTGDGSLNTWVNDDYFLGLGSAALDPQSGLENQRVLGRLALLNNLRGEQRQTQVNLWERIQQAAQKARDDQNRLTVILVSRLDDDVSSGQFLDTAYIAKTLKTVLGFQNVRLIGHLVTDEVNNEGNQVYRQMNTIAAIRELSRFQLADNTPFNMMYYENDLLDGYWDQQLFDELYMYDGHSNPRRLNVYPAARGVYPAIADSIAMWLDTASAESGLEGWRNGKLNTTRTAQTRDKALMVSGLGLYQYILPFTDLLDEITLRYASNVLYRFLMGAVEGSPPPRLDATLATEQLIPEQTVTVDQLPVRFFQQQLGGTDALSGGWRYLLNALAYSDDNDVHQALKGIKVKDNDPDAWQTWLKNTLLVLLNGRADNQEDIVVKRGAKLGLALEFLDGIDRLLQQSKTRIREMKHKKGDSVVITLEAFSERTRSLRSQLMRHVDGLGLGDNKNTTSLYDGIINRLQKMESIWDELNTILTRQYILTDADGELLSKTWYEQLMAQKWEQGLTQFYWQFVDGELELVLHKMDIRFDPQNPAAFEAGILALGRYFAESLRSEMSLGTILRQNQLDPENLNETATILMESCGVLLGLTDGAAPDLDKSLILSVNETVREADQLEQNLAGRQTINELRRLNTSDPFTLTLAQTADTIPLTAVPSLRNAEDQYNAEEAITAQDGYEHPTAIFPEEVHALKYERRFSELSLKRHLVNPVLVSALYVDVRARVYLLGAALKTPWQLKQTLTFYEEEMQEPLQLLDANQLQFTVHGALVDGLLQFVQKIPTQTAETIYNRYMVDDDALEILDDWSDANEGADWRGTPHIAAPLQEDLIILTRLIINDLLE